MPDFTLTERAILTEQTFASVMQYLDMLYKLWPLVVGASVVGIVWWRTRSLFFIFHQILKWLGLEGKYTNADDQKLADDYLDLNKFNLKTGFHLRSVKAKTALHGWMREHDLEFAVLRRAGWFFKANELKIDTPKKWQTILSFVLIILLGLAFFAGGQFVQGDGYALLKVNATGTWFWVGDNEAYSVRFDFPEWLRGDHWRLQQGDCRYVDDPAPVLKIWDKDVICRLVLGMNDGFISDAIASQTRAGWILKFFGAVSFLIMGFLALWLGRARQLQAMLEAKPAGTSSTSTDAGSSDIGSLVETAESVIPMMQEKPRF